jgi:copper chaperone CopZ
MRVSAAAFPLLLVVALTGCDKPSRTGGDKPRAIAASTQAPSPVKVMEPVAAVAAARAGASAGEAMCGGGGGGSCCGGDAEMCAGGCTSWDEAAGEVAAREIPAGAQWKTIKVAGMTCGGCERRIIAHLGKVDGILAVEADAEVGEVRVAMARDTDLRTAAVERINALGYSAQ